MKKFAMKRKHFSVEKIVAVLKQAELGMPGGWSDSASRYSRADVLSLEEAICRGLQSDQVRELKQLQDENTRIKKLVAELSLDKAVLQDVATKKWGGPRWNEKWCAISQPLPAEDTSGLRLDAATTQLQYYRGDRKDSYNFG
jgi:putative transposase